MKIAAIFDQTIPYLSGYSIRSRYITDSIKRLGVTPLVFSSPNFLYKSAKDSYNGIDYYRCDIKNWNTIKKIPFIKELLIISELKKTIDLHWDPYIKLIHAHSPVLNALAGISAARKHNVPFVYEVRALWEDAAVDQGKTREGSLRYKFTRRIETDVLKKADKITVICEGLKHDIVSRGIKEDKITVVSNGVDIEKFKPVIKDEETAIKYGLRGCIVIGFIGTFFLFEGLDILIKAAHLLVNKRSNIKFMIVGSGVQEESLKKMVEGLGLSQYFIFTGRARHDDILKYYSVADILVYPRVSKRITELVTPLKPLEAMALEKFVIASDVGGLKELVRDGVNGVLFNAGDHRDLAEKCIYAIDNLGITANIAKQAREYVVRERNWLQICKKYIELYRSLGVSS